MVKFLKYRLSRNGWIVNFLVILLLLGDNLYYMLTNPSELSRLLIPSIFPLMLVCFGVTWFSFLFSWTVYKLEKNNAPREHIVSKILYFIYHEE